MGGNMQCLLKHLPHEMYVVLNHISLSTAGHNIKVSGVGVLFPQTKGAESKWLLGSRAFRKFVLLTVSIFIYIYRNNI